MSAAEADTPDIEGTVHAIVFHNEENGYTIMQVATEGGETVTVLGKLPAVTEGEQVRAWGNWRSDRRFGRQFQADRIRAVAPHSPEGMERFLASGLIDGIGDTYAKRIVNRFGEDTFRIIEEESKRLEEVPGIGDARRRRIKESWTRQKSVRDIMIFLHAHGLSTARALRLYKSYGEEAVDIVRADPYRLARELPGVGFRTADEIARQMGQDPESPRRLRAGLLYVLEQAERQGHCALPRDELVHESSATLSCSTDAAEATLNRLVLEGEVVVENDGGTTLVFSKELHEAEETVAAAVAALLREPSRLPPVKPDAAIDWFERHHRLRLGEEQAEAVLAATRHRISVLTGGPGVGKTTILQAVLEILVAKKVQPVLCAPTGRAAKRLTETTGREAHTLHRALEYQPEVGFGRNRHKPLQGDLFVIDESSMVDVRLMARFLEAVPPGGSVLLVGDVDQLPSVGPGNILHDLVESGAVAVSRLTRIYRQSATGRIVTAAHDINEGRMPPLANEPDADFFFIERDGPEAIRDTLRTLVAERIPEGFGLNARDDVQVLTPMNRQSLGTAELNDLLRECLNPPGELKLEIERFGGLFRSGDKVIQVRNNYEKDVFNGDIGHIAEVTTEPAHVHVTFDEDRHVAYEPGELDELKPAYAVTIHKAQGSEFPAVVIPLASQHYMMLQRNLLYTAITRGKRLVILVGERKALETAVRNRRGARRHTGLEAKVRQAASGADAGPTTSTGETQPP